MAANLAAHRRALAEKNAVFFIFSGMEGTEGTEGYQVFPGCAKVGVMNDE